MNSRDARPHASHGSRETDRAFIASVQPLRSRTSTTENRRLQSRGTPRHRTRPCTPLLKGGARAESRSLPKYRTSRVSTARYRFVGVRSERMRNATCTRCRNTPPTRPVSSKGVCRFRVAERLRFCGNHRNTIAWMHPTDVCHSNLPWRVPASVDGFRRDTMGQGPARQHGEENLVHEILFASVRFSMGEWTFSFHSPRETRIL